MPAMPFPAGTNSTAFFTTSGIFTADISRNPPPSRTWTVPATAPTCVSRCESHSSVSLTMGFMKLRKKLGHGGVQLSHQCRRGGQVTFAAEPLEVGGSRADDRRG